MKTNGISSLCLFLWVLIILASFATTRINAVQSDIDCLKSIKNSLEDPENVLSSWDFNNNTDGFICRFTGVDCWYPDESKVLGIRLPNMGLRGSFPMGLKNCTSITTLDLSGNYLSGSLPSNISDVINYIMFLDLSNNNFSGPIPPSIVNCSLINVLRLANNQLTGRIPPELSRLHRIIEFTVANNRLSGRVPVFGDPTFPEESYANNLGLCGRPLDACKHDLFLSGFAVGFPLFTTLTMLFMFFRSPTWSIVKRRLSYLLPIERIERRLHHLIPRSLRVLLEEESSNDEGKVELAAIEKLICQMSLAELEMATNGFNDKSVIGHGNIGVMYKGAFVNGLVLAVKRLHRFDESLDKRFLTEIKILGKLRQMNLVPLIGFCFEINKKFLVYKYMCNGTLHDWLHCMEGRKMGWALRLKIAVGIARGLAWLHHNNVLRVAHLKINSKCILLDEKFEPKISNFGDAMIFRNAGGTPPSSGFNFEAPDSSLYKEDVYSFGILLLELVTGTEPQSTWIDSTSDHVIDACLMGQEFSEEIRETIRIAENCIHPDRDDATSMLQVYQEMRSIRMSRNEISVAIHRDESDARGYHDLAM
ncbi:hypothetical protein OSB04_025653 [Centaurea solstitialis]|uniref:Protein kinase domain-containing protein n=1 Tax=Centaurea solstitialis TaxID=347529 RepID=A0AA38WEZ4_9ASTR|nr:hypothetical protein OSB04_025653 [Centaurea solstitialis]